MENKTDDKNIHDTNESTNYNYDPNYYLEKNVNPNYLKSTNNKNKLLGLWFLITGLVLTIVYTLIFIIFIRDLAEKNAFIVFSLFAYTILTLQIIGGIRTLTKAYSKEQIIKIKRRIVFSTIIIIVVCIGIFIIVSQFKKTSSTEITNANQIKIRQIDFKDYIYIKGKELKCSEKNADILRGYIAVPNEDIKYIITYEFYTFNTTKGKITKLAKVNKNK